MSKEVILHGRKRPKQQQLNFIRIGAHPDGTRDRPAWIVEHHHVGEDEPVAYEIHHGDQLLDHIAEHAAVPDEE